MACNGVLKSRSDCISFLGQKRRIDRGPATSGLPLPAILRAGRHVSEVPPTELISLQQSTALFNDPVGAPGSGWTSAACGDSRQLVADKVGLPTRIGWDLLGGGQPSFHGFASAYVIVWLYSSVSCDLYRSRECQRPPLGGPLKKRPQHAGVSRPSASPRK